MLRQLFCIAFLAILSSCNRLSDQSSKNDSLKNSTKAPNTLEERANDFYQKDQYSKAKLCYDSLIAIDSNNGGYYFKRAYCKSRLSSNDPSIIPDYFKAILHNYGRKQSAYLNIGIEYRFKAVFRSTTNEAKKAQYDSALYFYNECLKIDPSNIKARQEKQEVTENLNLLK